MYVLSYSSERWTVPRVPAQCGVGATCRERRLL